MQRRIPGTISTGLSGNILNYATATRVDCALKALIGGPGTCDSSYCYVTGQGERSYLRESTNIQGEFYVRPCTSDSSSTYPDDYSSGTYATKTTYVSISGRYTGTISTSDSYTGSSSSKYYYHAWKFTTTGASHIDVTLTGTWSSGTSSYVALFSSTSFSGTATTSASGNPAVLSYDISSAGTYYLVVRSSTKNVTGTYTLSASQELTAYTYKTLPTRLCPPGDSSGQSSYEAIGSIPQAQIKIKEALADRSGVIQQTFNQVRYGLMYYNSDNEGKILVGCHNTSLSTLLSAFTSIYPYNGTPTGEALYGALDYFKQSADHTYASNTSFISKGTSVDPYYQKDINGVAQPVPCRQSYVVVISDGGWNGDVDPVKPARELHAFDLRTETTPTDPTSSPANQPYFRDTQSVNVFSIFAFGTDDCGKRSMKGVAMFGGFTDGSTSSCGSSNTWPYSYTAYPSTSTCEQSGVTCSDTATGSRCMKWPQTNCDPSGTYNDCCKEWDTKWDSYTSGDNLDKGIPDNYFEASEGQALQSALMTVIQSSIVKNATASAVATVAQQTQEGDIIVRGLFHAADPDTVGRYLWFGHLEAYWPYLDESTMVYHYDFETNPCFQITSGTKHCWDGAQILQSRDTNDRTLYTWDTSTKTQVTVPIVPTSGSIDPPWTSTATSTWQTKLGVTTSPTPSDLISWVRGIDVDGLRTRTDSDNLQWRLGDIVYSTPVVVGTPTVGGISTHDPNRDEFYAYRNEQYYRDKVIYVGANDGMIHAFLMAHWDSTSQTWFTQPSDYADIGKELWAYIPSNLLTEFQYVANSGYGANDCLHRSMVDLAPQSWEVYIMPSGATTRSWRTVILGGERGGGDVYFAIDVTDPYNPVVLWEYSMFLNRVVYDRTGSRSLTNCAAHPSDSYSDTYCKAANLDNAWLFVDTSSSPNSGSPTASTYQTQLKVLPVAWSRPAVGRLRIPASLTLYTGDPAMPGGQSPIAVSSFNFNDQSPWPQTINGTSYHMPRHVAFVGGGARIFQDDTRVEKDPLLSSAPTTDGVTSAAYRFDLFRPDFMAIDIETGTNLFRYYCPPYP
ncbi:MAG: PilC/PilY family type IV pilus protein, partial [Candidatus Marsarchaeota archaeon]|nr:PilC/PilY family type IV pilus protein [Candidatus Marsarchaeota archaeon]